MRDELAAANPGFDATALGSQAWARLERLAGASPLYARLLVRHPEYCRWLEEERNLRAIYRYQALIDEWRAFLAAEPAPDTDEFRLARLRRWRRLMSLRIAHRSVNELADEPTTAGELTRLAEFCLRACLWIAERRAGERLGEPWDEEQGRRARFGVIALGKLGGGELNFSSDVDLLYCYEGDGHCRRGGVPTETANAEFFALVAETTTRLLSAQTADGFLFRVDARLRPSGAWGPLAPSLSALESYYATAGQTWERLALVKARPVAGDLALGAELLEDLHPFRYPRRPPPSLLAEMAAMKRRTEREVVGAAALERDVKRGPGGIREIEFVAQSLQLLHAGRYPFLQTHSTAAALGQLALYQLLDAGDARTLAGAYWFLRRVEHRLQMREELQTHTLPAAPDELAAVATSLGFASAEAFTADLADRRRQVQAIYAELFADRAVDPDLEAWWEFFTTEHTPAPVAARIAGWFGDAPGAAAALRRFVGGDHPAAITRELVARFPHLAASLDTLVPDLAQPLETLNRLARCAERYGTRLQFLNASVDHPQLLRALGLLCDRSSYAVELLCAHPEILEEVLRPEILRRRKTPRELAAELAAGPADPGWLWLYVRAEQMRHAIGELLGFWSVEEMEAGLTQLADAALRHVGGGSGPVIVALGKYGGGELTYGSDLDLIFVGREDESAPNEAAVGRLRKALAHGGPLGPAFALDLRLRPHGDAGPLVTTRSALAAYHDPARPGGETWERQMLLRARVVAGPPAPADDFRRWLERLLYAAPPTPADETAIWAMRVRIEREREPATPRERAFKTGAGGLIDIEFLAQALQWRGGHADARLRTPGTRAALRALAAAEVLPPGVSERLIDHYDFLKRMELALQRDANGSVSVLPATAAERAPLARWLGFSDEVSFWAEHVRRLRETRQIVRSCGGPEAQSALGP